MRTVIYVRVSTDEQAQGSSLLLQEEACRAYCTKHRMDVVRVFREEGESAKSDNRPQFQEMLRYCADKKNRVDHVLVHKSDRFARAVEDYYYHTRQLREKGVTLRSATEEVEGDYVQKLMRGVLAQIAEFDNDVRSDRSRSGMKRVAERGGWPFQAPMGYRCVRAQDRLPVLEPDPVTGPLVQKLFEAIASGRYSTAGVTDYATELGLRSGTGTPLYEQAVHKMLRNPVYAGRIRGKLTDWTPVTAAFPPLVPEALYDRVQAVLAGRGHVPSPHACGNPEFPLRRLLKCCRCGHALTASFATGSRGKRYGQYRCAQKGCRAVNVRRELVEPAFLKLLTEIRIESAPLLQAFRRKILDQWRDRRGEVAASQVLIQARADSIMKQQAVLLDKTLRGVVDESTYQQKNSELSEQLSVTRAQMQESAGDEFDVEAAMDLACQMVQNAGRLWYQMTVLGHRQRLQNALFPEGLVYGNDQGFGTAVTSWPITALKGPDGQDQQLAPPRRIELLLPG